MLKFKKINFVGAQSTGKTSVFEALKQENCFKDFIFYESISRQLANEGLKVNEDGGKETQKILFDKYLELLEKMMNERAISNRCILDVASYTAAALDSMFPDGEDYQELSLEDYRQRKIITQRKEDLSLLVYFPIEFPIVADGVRSINEDYRQQVDQKIQQYLNNCRIPHIRVTGTVEERVVQIKTAFGALS